MVSTLSIIFMVISAVISIGLPICLFLFLRRKYRLKVIPLLVGAVAFIVFAMVLEQLLHMLVLRPANGVIELKNNPLLYVLYGIFAAGIFEETARFLSFLLLKKRYSGIGTGLSYGIGHGGIEAVLIAGISMISNIVVSIMINSGTSSALGASVQAQLTALVDTTPYLFLISGFERILAVIMQISLSLLVWVAVARKDKWWLFPTAIVLHAIVDIPAALMQVGILKSIILTEGLLVVNALVLAMIAVFVCKSLKRSDENDLIED